MSNTIEKIDHKKRSAHIVELTKELTDYLLSINTHNRLPIASNVDRLGAEMTSGEWELTSSGIGICEEGYITNGGNRLLAHKQAGYPDGVEVVIVTGLSYRAQQKEDIHAKRNMAAIIKLMLNKTVSLQLVSAVRSILRMREGNDGFYMWRNSGASTISENEIAEFIDTNMYIIDCLSPHVGPAGVATRAGVFAALIEFSRKGFLDSACNLAEKIRTGANIDIDHPAYKLRAWKKGSLAGGDAYITASYAVTVSVCCAFANGRPLRVLKESKSWRELPSLSAWTKRNIKF